MDDAGIPSLMTITYLNYAHDETYENSRRFSLSSHNPYFYKSVIAEGTGSPHLASEGDMIWPMGIIARGMTATDDAEIKFCLRMLKATHAGTGFMHEGFQKDNPEKFTRHWFAWANSFFGEFIWNVYKAKKELL
jgi:meiotically up-regulated gene 157 (Mug157) protein